MNIGDTVKFLNDIGGGKITAFRPGGIVLVEDEDGFDIPMPQAEVVVIAENTPPKTSPQVTPKVEYGTRPVKENTNKPEKTEQGGEKQVESLNGKQYLQSKTIAPAEEELDENLEAHIVRLEMALQKLDAYVHQLESRLARLEAENNLRKNEKMMHRTKKFGKPAPPPQDLDTLQIL